MCQAGLSAVNIPLAAFFSNIIKEASYADMLISYIQAGVGIPILKAFRAAALQTGRGLLIFQLRGVIRAIEGEMKGS